MFAKYFTCNSKQKTDHETSQDNESAREELGAWKEEINWNNCLLEWWICYRYYEYSQQNHFAGSTIACLNQSLHFRLMWNPEILDLWRIFSLQVRKLWRNSPFTGPNRKTCMFTWNSEYLITCFYFFISLSFWYIYICMYNICILYIIYTYYTRRHIWNKKGNGIKRWLSHLDHLFQKSLRYYHHKEGVQQGVISTGLKLKKDQVFLPLTYTF